jgi:hypothetical protein
LAINKELEISQLYKVLTSHFVEATTAAEKDMVARDFAKKSSLFVNRLEDEPLERWGSA